MQKLWKNRIVRIIIIILFVLCVLFLLYLAVRYFFPGIPYAHEDLSDLSEHQLRQMIRAFNTSYARLGLLCVLLCAAFLSTSFWLHHFYVTEKNRAADLEKKIEKEKTDYQKSHEIWEELKESYKGNEKELKDQIEDLKKQLKTEGIDNSDLYKEIDELQSQVKKLQSDINYYKDDWEAEYDVNSELKEKIKKKDALIQDLTKKLTE